MCVDAVIGERQAVADKENPSRWVRDDSRILRSNGAGALHGASLKKKHPERNAAAIQTMTGIHDGRLYQDLVAADRHANSTGLRCR